MLKWEQLASSEFKNVYRTSVPGGWLVAIYWGGDTFSTSFVPDSDHGWDGSSVEVPK